MAKKSKVKRIKPVNSDSHLGQPVKISCQGADVIALDKLTDYQGSLKTLSEASYEKLKKSILDLGFSFPVQAWKHRNRTFILDAHQRVKTLRRMRDEGYVVPELPVVWIEAKDRKEAAKKLLAATSQYGEMSASGLRNFADEFALDLKQVVDLCSFPEINLEDLKINLLDKDAVNFSATKKGAVDDDEIPEVKKSKIKIGQTYQLGKHRLMCGDATDSQHRDKLLANDDVDMVFTDPPYGISEKTDRVKAKRGHATKAGSYEPILGDESVDTALKAFENISGVSETICYWGGNYYAHNLPPSPSWIVWDKRVEENQRDDNSDCELAYVVHPTKKSIRIFRHLWKGMIKGSEHGQARVHPTQKPVALAEWCITELNPLGKVILDVFGGSGSTLIACEKLDRKCLMMELSPEYCDVIIARWEKYTGKKATLIAG